jgi:hypothetical protein
MPSTVQSITTHGMTDLVTSTNNVVRAAMTNLAACVTGAVESFVGNHSALWAFRAIAVDAFQLWLEQNLCRRIGSAKVVYDTQR